MSPNGFHQSNWAIGGSAAILAPGGCREPRLLAALGVGGAWIGNLTLLEPYRPVFVGAALVAVFFAGRHIFRSVVVTKAAKDAGYPSSSGRVLNE